MTDWPTPDELAEAAEIGNPVFSCCYCARVLTEDTPDWVGVSLYDKDTGEPGQMWFAHELCFRQKLHPDYDISPDDEFQEPGTEGEVE